MDRVIKHIFNRNIYIKPNFLKFFWVMATAGNPPLHVGFGIYSLQTPGKTFIFNTVPFIFNTGYATGDGHD